MIFVNLLLLVVFANSAKLFLVGGALAETGEIWTAMGKSTGKPLNPNNCSDDWTRTSCPKVAVVTSAAPSQKDGNSAYNNDTEELSYQTMFRRNGFTTKHISAHIDNYKKVTDLSTAEGIHNLNIMLGADIVFFNGGDQARHSRTWLLDDGSCNPLFCKVMVRCAKGETVFAGTSAGTMIMSNPTYGGGISFGQLYWHEKVGLANKSVVDGGVNGTGLSDDRNGSKGLQYEDNGGKMPGFQVFNNDYLFDTHFDARGRLARFIPALRDTNKSQGIGVDENTAIFIDGEQGHVYGANGVWVVHNRNATYHQDSFFSVENVSVSYLTSGDSINLETHLVNSSKQLIVTPQFSGSANSSRVVDAYEMTHLITRLVDQDADTNTGQTKTPSGYNSSTPHFEFVFRRGSQTKGYNTGGKYTVDDILVSIAPVLNNILLEEQ